MSNCVQLGDVHTYYEEDGAGEPLVLLHPGLADSRAFEDYVPELAQHFYVFRPDRRGHGRTPDVDGPITYELMARDTIAFLEQVVGGPAYLLGHSDGAPVALLAALERPDLVRGLVFIAGVFHHDGWAPGAIDLDDETIAFSVDYWGAVAPDGPAHFSVVKAKLYRMHCEEPTLTVADLAGYPGPALVLVGDSDEEIPMGHTLARDGLRPVRRDSRQPRRLDAPARRGGADRVHHALPVGVRGRDPRVRRRRHRRRRPLPRGCALSHRGRVDGRALRGGRRGEPMSERGPS
jgi:pimeloyl-ACP methyl ester carboxylesterase